MKKTAVFLVFIVALMATLSAQPGGDQIPGKEVFRNNDVVFRQIDDHTWVGTGNLVSNESLYLIEGNDRAVLVDAGTRIDDLKGIVERISGKEVILVATHVHPDHTGTSVSDFPAIFINPADTVNIPGMMPGYKGEVRYLKDGEILDLGGRKLEVVFTPGHTPGSATYIDREAGYGFSGDAFGSGNLLLTTDFLTLIATCEKAGKIMDKYAIKFFYPGHFFGNNLETRQRVADMITLSKDVLSGRVKGQNNPNGMLGLNLVVNDYGVRINYTEKALK